MINMGELFAHRRIGNPPMSRVVLSDREANVALVQVGDLLFARRSLTLEGAGKCSIVLDAAEARTFESSLIRVRLDPDKADPAFYYYLFRSQQGRALIGSIVEQVAAAGIRGSDLRRLSVPYPPPSEQRAIGRLLGALDDKIDLNGRLGSTAQRVLHTLFEQSVVARNSSWSAGTLAEVLALRREVVQPTDMPSRTPYVGLEHMTPGSIALEACGVAADVASTKLRFEIGDILFGKLRPYFKKVAVPGFDGICSSDILVTTPKPGWYGFCLGHLSSDAFIAYTQGASTGTKMPRVSWLDVARYPVAIPPEETAQRLTSIASPFVLLIQQLVEEAATLAAIRDTLLPKLMSGEIRVPQAEKLVEQVT